MLARRRHCVDEKNLVFQSVALAQVGRDAIGGDESRPKMAWAPSTYANFLEHASISALDLAGVSAP